MVEEIGPFGQMSGCSTSGETNLASKIPFSLTEWAENNGAPALGNEVELGLGSSMHVADQVDATTDDEYGRNGPEQKYRHRLFPPLV
jgi:hypothetical protein